MTPADRAREHLGSTQYNGFAQRFTEDMAGWPRYASSRAAYDDLKAQGRINTDLAAVQPNDVVFWDIEPYGCSGIATGAGNAISVSAHCVEERPIDWPGWGAFLGSVSLEPAGRPRRSS